MEYGINGGHRTGKTFEIELKKKMLEIVCVLCDDAEKNCPGVNRCFQIIQGKARPFCWKYKGRFAYCSDAPCTPSDCTTQPPLLILSNPPKVTKSIHIDDESFTAIICSRCYYTNPSKQFPRSGKCPGLHACYGGLKNPRPYSGVNLHA